jgi:hypothetical protein
MHQAKVSAADHFTWTPVHVKVGKWVFKKQLCGGPQMRVNVYEDEQTGRVEPTARCANGTLFKGIRLSFCFPQGNQTQTITHGKGDDDTPAVTFFFSENQHYKGLLRKVLKEALRLLDAPDDFEEAIVKAKQASNECPQS